MKKIVVVSALMLITSIVLAQDTKIWTEKHQQYLSENLCCSKEELKEKEGPTEKQWPFKESEDRWSIHEVLEYVTVLEIPLVNDVTRGLWAGHRRQLYKTAKQDSLALSCIMEDKPHYSLGYIEPFAYTIPVGLNDRKITDMLYEALRRVHRIYQKHEPRSADCANSRQVKQVHIPVFGHADHHTSDAKDHITSQLS